MKASPYTLRTVAERQNMPHGIAGDAQLLFVTEPLNGRVAVLDRETGAEIGELPAPAGGLALPFQLRLLQPGRLALLDAGGFPSPTTPAIPTVHEYVYSTKGGLKASIERSIRIDSVPIGFAEDFQPAQGFYLLSDSVLGAIWIIEPDGSVVLGIGPSSPDPADAIPALAAGAWTPITVDGLIFSLPGGFAPGVGSMTTHGGHLYFGSSALGGIRRVPLHVFHDHRAPQERQADIEVVTPRPDDVVQESLKGLAFHGSDLYACDMLQGRLLRIDVQSGQREVVASSPELLRAPVTAIILPGGLHVTACDQEHRMAGLNSSLTENAFILPFRIVGMDLAG